MKEKDFEMKVKEYLKEEGCWILKTWSNGVQRDGVPDLLVCCHGIFLGVELKAENGKPSPLQLWNIRQIRKACGIAVVLYPEQFDAFKDLVQMIKMDKLLTAMEYQYLFKERKGKDERN